MAEDDQATDLLIRAEWVLPMDGPPLPGGEVRVRGDRIVSLGPAADPCAAGPADAGPCRRVDLGAVALLPGLVNVHTHLELTLLRGRCESLDFFGWIRELTGIKYGRMEREDFALGARWGADAGTGSTSTVSLKKAE